MKIKKTVSQKVIAANQANGGKTTGPNNCERSKMNAVTHALLAKRLLLNEDQTKEFALLLASLELEYEPQTASERMMVDDLAALRWKLQSAQTLEMRQLKNRAKSAELVFEAMAAESDADDFSPVTRELGLANGAEAGWECTELTIASSNGIVAEHARKGDFRQTGLNDPRTAISQSVHSNDNQKHGTILVQAKVNTGIETIVRYEKSLRNDFYRAMDILRRLKGRRGISGTGPGGRKDTTEE